jgi:hypothetical protein
MTTAKFQISHVVRKPRVLKKPMTQAERDAAMKKNWGIKAFNTVQRFRKIWDEEGAKLA